MLFYKSEKAQGVAEFIMALMFLALIFGAVYQMVLVPMSNGRLKSIQLPFGY